MTRDQIVQKLEDFLNHFHAYNLEAVVAMFAENATAEHPNGDLATGRKEIREQLAPYFSRQMGDGHWDIERTDVDEPNNIAWSVWTMTLTSPGRTTTLRGCETFEFNNEGLITRQSVFVKADPRMGQS